MPKHLAVREQCQSRVRVRLWWMLLFKVLGMLSSGGFAWGAVRWSRVTSGLVGCRADETAERNVHGQMVDDICSTIARLYGLSR
jgi:hypothetical protein